MKTKFLFIFFFLSIMLFSQQETLITDDMSFGGYGGPVVKFSSINGKFALFTGGRGAVIINNSFTIGGGGYGLVNELTTKVPYILNINQSYQLGYGGLDVGYFINPSKLIHFYVHALFGGGSIMYRLHNPTTYIFDNYHNYATTFFVFEPEAEIVMNVTKWMKISAGVSYRYFSNFEFDNSKSKDFMYPSAMIGFSFGSF